MNQHATAEEFKGDFRFGSTASVQRCWRQVRYCSDRYQNGVTQYL
jgi:hypothetical protein